MSEELTAFNEACHEYTPACRGVDPNLFFSDSLADKAEAKSICAVCPVREPCLSYALRHEKEGIWGGHDEYERRKLRRIRQVSSMERVNRKVLVEQQNQNKNQRLLATRLVGLS